MRITVLGAGLVGLPMATDLAKDKEFQVSLVDIRKDRFSTLDKNDDIKTIQADLSDDQQLRNVIKDSDLVVSAVPGHMGFHALKTIIEEGKTAVDIAFFPEDLFQLDMLAKAKEVTAVCDIGVAPGMSNILSVYSHHMLEKTEKVRIYVGGLPVVRKQPFEYKAGFSPIDVIEEYTRPARYIRDGKIVEMPALSEPELIDFPQVGTLEAFNSDGLRSLINTLPCPDMIEKTLRYPGHIEKIKLLRDIGLFSYQSLHVRGQLIRPIDLTSELLFPMWELGEEEDLTVMKIIVEGQRQGKSLQITWDLLDYFDKDTGIHSMARTTGYTATATVRLIAAGLYTRKGISPPEYLAEDNKCVAFLLNDLEKHNVIYRQNKIEKEV
jgi:saccharopine dehydrogenase-like NADP-dependent oxidoreductase